MTPHRCGYWIGPEFRHCYSTERLRLFLGGLRCPLHTPARLANKPEPPGSPNPVTRRNPPR